MKICGMWREWQPPTVHEARTPPSLRQTDRYTSSYVDHQLGDKLGDVMAARDDAPVNGGLKEAQPVLDGCYHRYPNTTGLRYKIRLFEKQFIFQAKGKSNVVDIDDVIGCHVMRLSRAAASASGGSPADESAFFCIFAYHLTNRRGVRTSARATRAQNPAYLARQRQTYVFEVDICASYANNLRVARKWQSAILWLLRGHHFEVDSENGDAIIPESLPAQRRYLCLVNPKSGPGRSLDIFLQRVRPVFSEADVSYLLLITERFNHAREFVRNAELDQWSGIVVVSGDGLMHEVYNGLMQRPDADKAVRMPIGIIPGGSGNGLARSICHASGEPYLADPILACTLGCVKGRVVPLDLVRIEVPSQEPIYSFLSFGWGMMSDIDIESEKLRAIGEIRFTLWAFWRIFTLRTYSGRISYLPATDRRRLPDGHLPTKDRAVNASDAVAADESGDAEHGGNEPPVRSRGSPAGRPCATTTATAGTETAAGNASTAAVTTATAAAAGAAATVAPPRPPQLPPPTFTFGSEPAVAAGSRTDDSKMLCSRSMLANISQELEERGLLERVDDDEMDRCHVSMVAPDCSRFSKSTTSPLATRRRGSLDIPRATLASNANTDKTPLSGLPASTRPAKSRTLNRHSRSSNAKDAEESGLNGDNNNNSSAFKSIRSRCNGASVDAGSNHRIENSGRRHSGGGSVPDSNGEAADRTAPAGGGGDTANVPAKGGNSRQRARLSASRGDESRRPPAKPANADHTDAAAVVANHDSDDVGDDDNDNENIYLEPLCSVSEGARPACPPLSEPNLPASWQVEEGRFVIVYSSLVSHLGTKLFFAPEARLNDGVCWLMLIKGEASRLQIASYFLNQEVGKHVDLPWVRLIPVKAFRLESFDESIMTVDGEMITTDMMQACVLPGKARVLSF